MMALPFCAVPLVLLALPRALAISSMTFEYGHDKSAQEGED